MLRLQARGQEGRLKPLVRSCGFRVVVGEVGVKVGVGVGVGWERAGR